MSNIEEPAYKMRYETESNTFQIPEENLPALKEKIAKLARKAEKLGLPPISMTVGAFTDTELRGDFNKPTGIIVRRFEVVVEGAVPKLAGWSFVATLERMDGEVMVRCTPARVEQMPTRYRNHETAGDCEHCNQKRRRSETFVLQHDSGKMTQVGRSCLADFLGVKSPQGVAAMAELLWDACETASSSEEGGGRGGPTLVDTLTWLAFVAAAIRKDGWVSKSAARE